MILLGLHTEFTPDRAYNCVLKISVVLKLFFIKMCVRPLSMMTSSPSMCKQSLGPYPISGHLHSYNSAFLCQQNFGFVCRVDAVMICSPSKTHEKFVKESLAVGEWSMLCL